MSENKGFDIAQLVIGIIGILLAVAGLAVAVKQGYIFS